MVSKVNEQASPTSDDGTKRRIRRRLSIRFPTLFNSSRWYLDRWVAEAVRAGTDKSFRVLDAGAGIAPYRKHFEHVTYETADFGEVDKGIPTLTIRVALRNSPWLMVPTI